ncbi:MAG: hypothetical protein RR334_02980 [Clostridia bacterium]
MNRIWVILLLSSITMLCFISPASVLPSMLSSATKAVQLSFELCAIYAVWMGIFGILEKTCISKLISKILSPIIDLIFGKKNLSPESKKYVSLNISANVLGMGGAATPMGIKAIESMNDHSGKATYPMVMLVVLCCTSLQLLPTSIMGLMVKSGSINPASIIFPSLIAGTISTLVGIILVKVFKKQIIGKN